MNKRCVVTMWRQPKDVLDKMFLSHSIMGIYKSVQSAKQAIKNKEQQLGKNSEYEFAFVEIDWEE